MTAATCLQLIATGHEHRPDHRADPDAGVTTTR